MKYLLVIIICLFLAIPTVSKVETYSPVVVIIDTDTGKVIRSPSRLDYQYDLLKDSMKYDKKPSLKERLFGRCKKR